MMILTDNKFKSRVVIVSGYFNPLHKGHLEYFENAKSLGDKLFVIVNNDHQRALKGSKAFQDENERLIIIKSLKLVDEVILSIDKDRSVKKTLEKIVKNDSKNHQYIFANGGDQFNEAIPEKVICDKLNIKLIDGLGEKIQSSSKLLKD